LHDDSLRAAGQRLRQLDDRIQSALNDVSVPEDLAERVFARLASTAMAPTGADQAITSQAITTVDEAFEVARRRRSTTRGRAWLAAGLATAAAVLIYMMLPSSMPVLSEEAIALQAREHFALPAEQSQDVATNPPPAAFPASALIASLPDSRWYALREFLGRSGVAYQLRRGGIRATLFVVKIHGPHRAPGIDERELALGPKPSSTAGSTAAVWRERDLLYVLVVQGSEVEYRHFLAPSPVVG
jgi:hypothetical protein